MHTLACTGIYAQAHTRMHVRNTGCARTHHTQHAYAPLSHTHKRSISTRCLSFSLSLSLSLHLSLCSLCLHLSVCVLVCRSLSLSLTHSVTHTTTGTRIHTLHAPSCRHSCSPFLPSCSGSRNGYKYAFFHHERLDCIFQSSLLSMARALI
jgi:hypothetical protein